MTWRPLLVGIPPLLLAVVGLTHPGELTTATSHHWTIMHIALVPIFPLLGWCLWELVRAETGPLGTGVRVAGFVYVCFYGALDALNGIAAGIVVQIAGAETVSGPGAPLRPLLVTGNTLGWVGSSAFLVGAALTALVAVRRCGRAAVPGAVLTVAAAVSFLDSHVYWPRGVLTMLVLAVGLVLLSRRLSVVSATVGPVASDHSV